MSARLVLLEGGSPWGFRMTGGSDTGSLLRISRVNPGSKAAEGGVREGDVICAINGQSTSSMSNSDAHTSLRTSGRTLSLSLNEEGSPRRRGKSAVTKTEGTTGSLSNGVPKDNSSIPQPLTEKAEPEPDQHPPSASHNDKSGGVKRAKWDTGAGGLLNEIDEALVCSKGFLLQKGDRMFSPTFKATAPRPGVWSPATPPSAGSDQPPQPNPVEEQRRKIEEEPIPPVWTPRSAQASPVAERKEFRPVAFESPTLPRKNVIQESKTDGAVPPWQKPTGGSGSSPDVKSTSTTNILPRAPNPTVTLLQKAREGQIPKGAQYLTDSTNSMPDQGQNEYHPNEVYFPSKSESERPQKIELGPRKPVAGIGPTTKEGIPIVLRSEVNEDNKEKWYKRMYESLHRPGKDGLYGYHTGTGGGYQSEPEPLASEEKGGKYATLDRRRTQKNKENQVINVTLPRRSLSRVSSEPYKNQPGRIENYQPGHSSISDIEANKWWDEVLEIFDRWLEANPGADDRGARQILAHAICRRQAERSQPVHKTHSPKSFMTYALKESGYDSDPQHVFKRREDEFQTPLSPQEQKEAYKTIQKGGEVPLKGLRKAAPERPKDDTEIEYFPLSPTLTRIRVHKQNITPLSGFPFPFPLLPIGVCSSYSQIQVYPDPTLQTTCTKKGSVYQFSRSPESGVKLQTVGEQPEATKVVPKPRNLSKKLPVYENLPVPSDSPSPDASSSHEVKDTPKTGSATKPLATFADLKRTAPSLVRVETKSRDEAPKKGEKKSARSPTTKKAKRQKVPLSESVRREKPLSKVQKRFKSLPDHLKKRKSEGKPSGRKRVKSEVSEFLSEFVEAELGPGYLTVASSDDPTTESSSVDKIDLSRMNPIFDSMNPNFPRREADYPPYRSRSFSPAAQRVFRKPSPPQRESSRNNSTLRMWSKMMVTYPYRRSRIDSFDSNVKYLQERLQRKLDGHSKEEEFGDDVETVRTVRKNRDGQMSIKTNRYVKIARPVSAGPPLRPVYDQNGRRVLSEPRKPTISPEKTSEPRKMVPKKSDTVLKSSTSYSVRNRGSSGEDEKGKSVKVTVAISAKGKESPRKSSSLSAQRKGSSKILSPSTSVSSFRSGASGKSVTSERGSTASSLGKTASPRLLSPSSTVSRMSSHSRTSSPAMSAVQDKSQKKVEAKKVATVKAPVTITNDPKKTTKVVQGNVKSPARRVVAPITTISRTSPSKTPIITSAPESKKIVHSQASKNDSRNDRSFKEELDLIEQGNQVRTDSFFQHLFLREPPGRKEVVVERSSSVLERARSYQRSIERPSTSGKSEPGTLNLVKFFLTQKRPVSSSKFKSMDRELSASRSPSPSDRSHSFHAKLRRFDSGSQFGDDLISFSPDLKHRSSSEPPIRAHSSTPEGKVTPGVISPSTSTQQFSKLGGTSRDLQKRTLRARSAGEAEGSRRTPTIEDSNLSSSSLHLSDHPEYQAYILELLHSTKKSERFRELHKFYVSLERMGELEKTASIGDLRPRLRNEEIIDYDRWKRLRTKERAEAELKALVGKLSEIQKEKDLVFRTTNVDALRWKGDRGLRAKDRSVEDLKEQFIKYSQQEHEGKREYYSFKDNYKPLWRGNSIINLATNLNTTAASHRGRPVTSQELEKIKEAREQVVRSRGKKPVKGWSSLSKEEVSALKSQLSEIYSQELKKKSSKDEVEDAYIIAVPEDSHIRAPGEKNLYVRCTSLLNTDDTFSRSMEKKDSKKKSKSISSVPSTVSEGESKMALLSLPWKEEMTERNSSRRSTEEDKVKNSVSRSKSTSAVMKPLSEGEKKRLSMTLSKEVLEKVVRTSRKSPVLPRETMGALVSSRARRLSPEGSTVASPRTCYSLDMSEDGKHKNDFLLVLTPTEKDVEKAVEDWANGNSARAPMRRVSSATTVELESASASSETSVKTVIKKPVDVLKKVEYFEDLSHTDEEAAPKETRQPRSRSAPESLVVSQKPLSQTPSYSAENIKELLGEERKYATTPFIRSQNESQNEEKKPNLKDPVDETVWPATSVRYHSSSPCGVRRGGSNDSLFSFRSRSVSPDPTKYYRAYLRLVEGGAVRKLRDKFESLEDLLEARDGWLRSPMKKSASDPELTRDMLKRYGTDPSKVVVRGQETGDVQWLKSKFENASRGRSRARRSPIPRTPFSVSDRFMPRINIISKTAELQLEKLKRQSRLNELAASPEPFHSLNEYTRDHGGYYYVGEVDKLRRKFEKLEEAERMSLMGQMYTSTPDITELRHIAPYLGCSWVAHQHPEVIKTSSSSPELLEKRKSLEKREKVKPRPHSSSPVRPKQLPSILKNYPSGDIFANQKFDPLIHRPKYRYQPEPVTYSYDRRLRWAGDEACWRHWNKPSVTFKELMNLRSDLNFPDEILESPRKYVESEVTIHYRSPVRSEAKEVLSEEELARRQAEAMRRIYQEERRRKYLQELQDMNSRRHTDNFTPSQKSPIPLNRYDDFGSEVSTGWGRGRDRTPEPRLVARALFTFVGQSPRELSFRRGDLIHVRRQIDRNWCEGEVGARIGLFPVNYVDILPQDGGARSSASTPSKPSEGQARAKFNFIAQSHLELSLVKGELVILTRRVDDNWYEGRVGSRRGIFPVSYVEVLIPPGAASTPSKPVASPAAHSLLLNGGTMAPHHYTPLQSPANFAARPSQALHIDTQTEPLLYRVVYSYKPVNTDELELQEGDTVLVMEKCDDGWFVGSSQTTGHFGTFPGNYVQRI